MDSNARDITPQCSELVQLGTVLVPSCRCLCRIVARLPLRFHHCRTDDTPTNSRNGSVRLLRRENFLRSLLGNPPSSYPQRPYLRLYNQRGFFSAAPAVPTSIVFLWPMAHPCARTRTVFRTTCAFSESPDALASRRADPDGCLRSSRRQLSLGDQVCPSIACAGRITRPDCINPA